MYKIYIIYDVDSVLESVVQVIALCRDFYIFFDACILACKHEMEFKSFFLRCELATFWRASEVSFICKFNK